MCEFSPADGGPCSCCPRPEPDNGYAQYIAHCRRQIEAHRQQITEWERQLADALAARGSRPGDGSDQPQLFDVAVQAKLFM